MVSVPRNANFSLQGCRVRSRAIHCASYIYKHNESSNATFFFRIGIICSARSQCLAMLSLAIDFQSSQFGITGSGTSVEPNYREANREKSKGLPEIKCIFVKQSVLKHSIRLKLLLMQKCWNRIWLKHCIKNVVKF